MFMVEIWVYCGPPYKFGRPKVLQLPILGTQFLNPGYDPALKCECPLMWTLLPLSQGVHISKVSFACRASTQGNLGAQCQIESLFANGQQPLIVNTAV